ncbi:hypothetical protein [Maribacter sp. 2308TA10-17]|uniref:hypothetical protein n=1 Tax=Maribacter sp. 2308TA10-17 TaxID=3386276 RepID=UPI0039BD5398
METQKEYSKPEQSKKVDRLHLELRQWQSNLYFMKDEMMFIERLLNSYAFQPSTPNLFERIQDYLYRLKNVKLKRVKLTAQIEKHENDLGGMLECTDSNCDLVYYQRHDTLKAEITQCMQAFQELKSEIFNYAGGILKKRKPNL